ncbi:MAG: HAMP domain-containing histidine kinase [Chloroflexi bacterium]|nr:MAG: HAMP domain-containing histidine kinase [Chloroflexota bacterium]
MSKVTLAVLTLAAMVVIWFFDVSTPPDLSASVFYLIPIALAAWFVGLRFGLFTAVLGAVLWMLAELIARAGVPLWIHLWNAATRGAIFVSLAILTTQLVRERVKLRTLDREREEALSFVAHELRKSVSSIEAEIPPLLRASGLQDEQHKALVSLRRQAHTLNRFAEDVLAVGRFEQGKFDLARVEVDLGEIVAQAARESTDPERVQLVLPSEPIPVIADADRLRLAIEHLLSNALKYSPQSSGVFARVSADDGVGRVEVRDSGVGLSHNDREVLFQKYGRVRNTRTESVLGVGLGLYVTRLLVEAHGGRVGAKSVGPGMGSTFTIELPMTTPSRAEAPQPHAEPRPLPR